MKKILVFGITDKKGGVESVIMNYYRNINRDKFQFDFLCNTKKVAYEDEITALGGKIYRITARSENFNQYKSEMDQFFKNHSKEYSTIWVNVCSLANIDYLIYAKKYGIKKRIIHCHNSQNMDSFIRGMIHRFNKIRLEKYATDFWTCSESSSKWFYSSKIINSSKYLVINNAINIDNFLFDENKRKKTRNEFNIDDDTLLIGNIGRFHPQKNHEFIIEIFKAINSKYPKSKLMLVGTGDDMEKIKGLVKKEKLANEVIFTGERKDVSNILSAMDVFLFPSKYEGLSVALIEAQANGLKCFTSKDVVPLEANISGEVDYISLNDKASEWAKKILTYYNDNKNLNRKINRDLFIKSGFDIKSEINKFEEKII